MEGGDVPRGYPRTPVTLFPRRDWTTTGTPDSGRSAVLSGSLTVAVQRSHVSGRERGIERSGDHGLPRVPHCEYAALPRNHPTPLAMTPVAIASHDKGSTPGVVVLEQHQRLARARSLPLLCAGGHCAGVPWRTPVMGCCLRLETLCPVHSLTQRLRTPQAQPAGQCAGPAASYSPSRGER